MSTSIAVALLCAFVLEVDADARPPLQFPLDADARFSVTYWHSMYLVPFTEDYVVESDGRFRLLDVRSPDGTAQDYFALEGTENEVTDMGRRFSSVSFLVAMQNPQTLTIGDRYWSFQEFGDAGSRVNIAPVTSCAGSSRQ